ncbi:pyridoxal phosphate-dependent aminotransferase [Chondromyces apiculatus]|nr:pyridoxal phosphate-dependent aminotransferase [Chondromyces apiculatus]
MRRHQKAYPALTMDRVMIELGAHAGGDLEPINFCQASSSFNPFEHVDVSLSRDDLGKVTPYASLNGSLGLRRAICRQYREDFGYDLQPERVCITAGATEALLIAFAMLTEPGGEVLLAASHFPPFRCLAHMFGVQCRFAPVNERHALDVEQLSRLITPRTQAIVINSPSNPHGTALTAAELEAVASLDVPVIFDEVYQALALSDERIASAIAFSDRHLIVNSFSKSLSLAGFRLGYLVVPETQMGLVADVKATTSFSSSAAGQAVCEALLEHRVALLGEHRALLRERWRTFSEAAEALGLSLYPAPQASLYGLVDLAPFQRDSARVAVDLARNWAVGVAPGSDFQTPDPRFLRLNYAAPSSQIEPGLRRIASYLQRH